MSSYSKEYWEGYHAAPESKMPYLKKSQQAIDWVFGKLTKLKEDLEAKGMLDYPVKLIE